LWGTLCIVYFLDGTLLLLQRDVFTYFTLSAGVFLVAMGYFKFVRGPAESASAMYCEAGGSGAKPARRGRLAIVAAAAVLAVPLALGLMVQGKGLNALAATQRGLGGDAQDLIDRMYAEQELNLQMDADYASANITQLYALMRKEKNIGRKVATVGFVVPAKGVPEGHLIIVRFLIWCCSADARPLPVLVQCEDADRFKTDQWVKVYGELHEGQFRGKPIPAIIADRVRLLEGDDIPDRPYLY